MAIALLVRVVWALFDVPDYWGDAYHNWIVERLTIENGFVFTDYKGRELVWLPLFRYLAAFVMAGTGLEGLLPGRLVSLVAGTAAVGLTAAATLRWTRDAGWALLAGLLLALNPWHIAYSWMNMPEAVGTLWVALAYWGISVGAGAGRRGGEGGRAEEDRLGGAGSMRKAGPAMESPGGIAQTAHPEEGGGRGLVALLVAGAFGALTRNDVTSILALTGGALLLLRQWRAALALFTGLLIGLAVWSAWTGVVTGNPLWWLARRAAGSTDDAGFWVARGSRPSGALLHLLGAWAQAATATLVTVVVASPWIRSAEVRSRFRELAPLAPLLVGGVYLAIVGVMFTRFFSWPDPRYLVMAVVPLTMATTLWVAALPETAGRRLGRGLIVVAVASTVLQLPTFPVRAWAHERDRIAGASLRVLQESGAIPEGPIWIDAPVAIYGSGLALDRIRSSDQITGWDGPEEEARSEAVAKIRQEGIGLVYWDEVPYSRVHRIWPEMSAGVSFESDGLRFTPIFRTDSVTRAPEAGWKTDVRERIQSKYSPVVLWRIDR